MEIIILILSVLNFIGLVIAGKIYFDNHYIIVDLDTWNTVGNFYNERHDDEGNEITQELAGGTGISVGFGADYLNDPEEPEEEEEDE